ncbi:2,3-diaminopropionate biosynthesis protein SbnB [Actinomadura napierensis]|uniref:2,3-diaminopropionate biosynthesis protein SbnB n=1 Tax=Actinomadura napierensis TaxID=267854 RepID=A0ABP5M2K2_9ACTN
MTQAPTFAVISGAQVHDAIAGREEQVIGMVEAAYRLHGEGRTVNPDSYFLRFPDRPSDRIIALPASVKGDVDVHGIKWISSFPDNVANGVPRASAVLILNDAETGYPFACLESSIISAARTAASASLAAATLADKRGDRPRRVGFIGVGLIARYIHTYLAGNGFAFDELGIHDLSREHAEGFKGYLERSEKGAVTVHDSAESLIRSSDLVVFATVAGEPHVTDPAWFAHNPLVLHVSLRDLSPEIILSAYNIVDDVEHCLKANTSPHLAEQKTGDRGFVAGTLYDVLTGATTPPADKPVIFSPFGLGVLDLAVAKYVHDQVTAAGNLHTIPGFFHEMKRYG